MTSKIQTQCSVKLKEQPVRSLVLTRNLFLATFLFSSFIPSICMSQRSAAPSSYTQGVLPPPAEKIPEEIKEVGIDERLGDKLNLNLEFKNETGESLTLGDLLKDQKPLILSPIYYSCPGLCNFHLNGLTEALKELDWSPNDKFRIAVVSFDSKETPEVAAAKKQSYMELYSRPQAESGWSFLTGSSENIQQLMEQIGFKYKWNAEENEWSHASAAIIVSPDGTLTRYLPGIVFNPQDIRLAILEGSQGKVGSFVDSLILYCFKYNPQQSRYTLYAFNIMKIGGLATILLLLVWILPVWLRSRKRTMRRM